MGTTLSFRHPAVAGAFKAFRIILGITFMVAGGIKLLSPEDFSNIIHNYRILPLPLVNR